MHDVCQGDTGEYSSTSTYQYDMLIPSQVIYNNHQQHKNQQEYRDKLQPKGEHTLRVYFQNINRIPTTDEMYRYIEEMKKKDWQKGRRPDWPGSVKGEKTRSFRGEEARLDNMSELDCIVSTLSHR